MSLAYIEQHHKAVIERRNRVVLGLTRLTCRARDLGISDASMKATILSLRSPDIGLLDDVEAQSLIDRFELQGA